MNSQKHNTEANWDKMKDFVPEKNELIIYDKDANYSYDRFKIGNGFTLLKDLPFSQNDFNSTEDFNNVVVSKLWFSPQNDNDGTLITNLKMTDTITDIPYLLYVSEEGKLSLKVYVNENTNVSNAVEEIELIDNSNLSTYKLCIENGKLTLKGGNE